jgi:hypothetical protein
VVLGLLSSADANGFAEATEPLADHHAAFGEAHRLLGQTENAVSHYREALRHNGDLPHVHARGFGGDDTKPSRPPKGSHYVQQDL